MTQPERTVEQRLAALEAAVEALRPVDITGDKYADFTVKRCPPQWLQSGGYDYSAQPISTTTPEFCDALASFLDWQASKDEEKNYSYLNNKGDTVFPAKYARKDAGRARAFARRLREQAVPDARRSAAMESAMSAPTTSDDEIPF